MMILYAGVLAATFMMLVGGIIFVALNRRYPKSVSILLGISAGFLLGIIFFGVIPESAEILEDVYAGAHWLAASISMVAGALFIILFEKMIPVQHHHDLDSHEAEHHTHKNMIWILLTAFGFHSLFELLSILVTGNADPVLAWSMVVVIGLHNIPIGFVILPQLESFGCSVRKSFLLLFALAVAETLLAVLCYLLLLSFITEALQGILLGMTGGIMLYLVFDELLPKIYQEEEQHHVNYAIILGAVLMFLFIHLMGH